MQSKRHVHTKKPKNKAAKRHVKIRPMGTDLTRLDPHPVIALLAALKKDAKHPLHEAHVESLRDRKAGRKQGRINLSSLGPNLSNQMIMRNFHYVRSEFDNAWAAQLPTAGAGYAKHFELDNLPGFTDFSTLYDQYRFDRVDFKLIPRNNVQSLTTSAVATTAVMPTISVWFDPDDSTAPSLVGESLEVENVMHCSGYDVVEGHFKPRAAIGAYGGAFTQFADFDGWVDCTSDDTQWYGLKAWVGAGGGSQTTFQQWDAFFILHVEFRKVR